MKTSEKIEATILQKQSSRKVQLDDARIRVVTIADILR